MVGYYRIYSYDYSGVFTSSTTFNLLDQIGGGIMKQLSIRQALEQAINDHDSPFITVPQLCKVLPANTNIHSIRCALSKSKLVGKSIRQSGTYVRRYQILGDVDGQTEIKTEVVKEKPSDTLLLLGKAIARKIQNLKSDYAQLDEKYLEVSTTLNQTRKLLREANKKIEVLKAEIIEANSKHPNWSLKELLE